MYLAIKGNVVTDEDPTIFLALNLAQRPILPCNAKFIDRRVEMFESARLLATKRWMPGILKKLLIGYPS